jgi:hypothetical protein
MRRKDRTLETVETLQILKDQGYGVLSTVDNQGQPYGVPLNFVYQNQAVYFHCARDGHKLDNLKDNPKVSFCIVGRTRVLPSEFATEYESAIVFGTAREVRGDEKQQAMVWLLEKYSPDFVEEGKAYMEKQDSMTRVIKIQIESIGGKARR